MLIPAIVKYINFFNVSCLQILSSEEAMSYGIPAIVVFVGRSNRCVEVIDPIT